MSNPLHRAAPERAARGPVSAAATHPVHAGSAAAVRILPPAAAPEPSPAQTPDAAERERRAHIRRWAKFMIVHLERSDFDQAPRYTYLEALERLKELLEGEIARARAADTPHAGG